MILSRKVQVLSGTKDLGTFFISINEKGIYNIILK